MTSVFDPAPLFDLVTAFPPDNAVDVTVPMPSSLAIYMTMLESTGHASELAVLQKIHVDQARETMRSLQARIGDVTGPEADGSARLRITHIVEQRVPGVNGLRPHVHAYVGATVRPPSGGEATAVDIGRLTAVCESDVFRAHLDGLVTTTTERVGLVWGETAWSSCEIVGARWLAERTAEARHEDLVCPGPWPRWQIVTGRQQSEGA